MMVHEDDCDDDGDDNGGNDDDVGSEQGFGSKNVEIPQQAMTMNQSPTKALPSVQARCCDLLLSCWIPTSASQGASNLLGV